MGAAYALLSPWRRVSRWFRRERPVAARAPAPAPSPIASPAVPVAAAPSPPADEPLVPDELVVSEYEITDDQIIPDVPDLPSLRAEVLRFYHARNVAPPSFPTVAARVLSRRNMSFAEIHEVVRQDIAIGAAVMRAANSAATGARPVDTLHDAITRLGVAAVSQIASGIAARTLFDPASRVEYELFPRTFNRLFHQSMTAALSAERFARALGLPDPERAFAGGLMHDVGKPVALRALAGLVVSGAWSEPPPAPLVERVLEDLHVEVGSALHESWGLPASLAALCRHHHDAALPATPAHAIDHVVRVVSGMNELRIDATFFAPVAAEVRQSLAALGLTRQQLAGVADELSVSAQLVTATFGHY